MQVHRVLPTTKILAGLALTVGTFDGVHRGHQLLAQTLHTEAQSRGLQSAALTFDDMPICFFRPDICPKLLSLADEKIEVFANQTPLDHLFIVPFTRELGNTSARDFLSHWVEMAGLKLFIGGPDFALGRGREGTIAQIAELGQELGFEARALDGKLLESGAPISSTRSRGVIEAGQVELSRAFLGHQYRMSGDVVSGDQIGRTIGAPTINLQIHERKCTPKNGVYAVRVRFDTAPEWKNAALNIGMRPTVGGLKRQIEFHVVNETIEVPPKRVELEFVARLRDEQRFSGLDELRAQLQRDFERAEMVLQETI
ncbi:riboflavin biosynthesis protein RibF [Abditibacteriota bacterium]|nr:riboflavin biosynthesis protein RibF [Abditibacteriota bacterium]